MKIMNSDKNSKTDDWKVEVRVIPGTLPKHPLLGVVLEGLRMMESGYLDRKTFR